MPFSNQNLNLTFEDVAIVNIIFSIVMVAAERTVEFLQSGLLWVRGELFHLLLLYEEH